MPPPHLQQRHYLEFFAAKERRERKDHAMSFRPWGVLMYADQSEAKATALGNLVKPL